MNRYTAYIYTTAGLRTGSYFDRRTVHSPSGLDALAHVARDFDFASACIVVKGSPVAGTSREITAFLDGHVILVRRVPEPPTEDVDDAIKRRKMERRFGPDYA